MRAADLHRFALVVPLALLAGCNLLTDALPDADATSAAWENNTNLIDEFGGYDYEAEEPAFGDPEMMKLEADEAGVEVPGEDVSIANEPGAFALRILWGQLEGNRDAAERIDWSGAVSVSSGAVAVLRTIAFEFPHDHLLERDSRQEVGFVSHTRPHFDGLLLVIKNSDDPEATLTFATGPLTQTFKLAELREIETVIPVDDMGNAVSLTGIVIDEPACPTGGLRGQWVHREGERGVFRGLWVTALGDAIGHLRGHFGMTDEGQRVWFAKIINREGDVVGLARGGWAPSEDLERPGGKFAGHFMTRDGAVRGEVGGHYVATRRSDEGVAGVFSGRWRAACDRPGDEPGDRPGDEPTDRPGDEPVDDPGDEPVDEPPVDGNPEEGEPRPDAP